MSEIKKDADIFFELENVYAAPAPTVITMATTSMKIQIPKKILNKDKGSSEALGGDFIAFDFSDEETKKTEKKESDENEENEEEAEGNEDKNDKNMNNLKRKEDSKHNERGGNNNNSNNSNNNNNKRGRPSSEAPEISTEIKKKLGKLFHPKAPWFPPHLKAGSSELADHYGYLTAPESKWKHFSERLHQELVDLTKYVSPTPAESAARSLVVRKCDAIVRNLFPGRKVECFGSFETGTFLPTSDIDLVVIPDHNGADNEIVHPPLRKLARALIKAGIAEGRSMQVISRARVPIIKFVDRLTGLPVDISFNVASGLDGAKFLKAQMIKYPALRPLVLVLKLFLDLRGLNEVFRGGLGSFSIACLLVSFFQVHPLIQLDYLKAEDNLGVLLIEFLELYGKQLNYEKVGVSIGIDEAARGLKLDGNYNYNYNNSSIDVPFGYYDKVDRGFYNDSRPGLLSIQDPQCPENDLARPSFSIASVKQAFEHAFNLLTAAAGEIDLQVENITAESSRNSNYKRGGSGGHQHYGYNKTDGSVLAALINIPETITRHREFIRQSIIPRE